MNLRYASRFLLVISFMLCVVSCKKKETTPQKPQEGTDFTKNMESHGIYQLEGITRYACTLCATKKDTTYASSAGIRIEVLNDSNIQVKNVVPGGLFTYDYSRSGCIVFSCRESMGYRNHATITYYYRWDSLIYYSYQATSGDSYEKTLHSM